MLGAYNNTVKNPDPEKSRFQRCFHSTLSFMLLLYRYCNIPNTEQYKHLPKHIMSENKL